jgi:CRISPR-associated protein Csb2
MLMEIVLRQVFPLGRFHSTPWRRNPFDDPYGEWPPSPWRLVRAIVARWYQWAREAVPARNPEELDALVTALCASRYRFHLPASAQEGRPLRQYFPVEFGWNPKEKKKAAMRTYGTSLAQDNYWCVAPTDAVWWFLEGDGWSNAVVDTLDQCAKRITYFGRAETFTRIRRAPDGYPRPNCELLERRGASAVLVLVPSSDASRADVERVTDDKDNVKRSIPPGSCVMYATRPSRPPARDWPEAHVVRSDCRLAQFAIGWNVAPELRAVARLTSRFRGAVLRELLSLKTHGRTGAWSSAAASIRAAVADMFGKDEAGSPLAGHRHAEFLAWCEHGAPTRAASRELSWVAAGPDADAWKVRLVPLDRAVPPPPGFDDVPARSWESVTPYVPPRHHLRGGKPRDRESLVAQIRRELASRGFERADEVAVEQISGGAWVAVHVPRAQAAQRASLGDRRAYLLRITFPEPICGPLRLGHSSSYGLGLFRPVRADARPSTQAE